MRDLLGFLVFAVIVFFVVGETIGWNVGIAGSTPVMVYKRDGAVATERQTVRAPRMEIGLQGRVRAGEVEVRIVHQDMGSFQTNRAPEAPRVLFEQTFLRGQALNMSRTFDQGHGRYEVQMRFREASGVFRVQFPSGADL